MTSSPISMLHACPGPLTCGCSATSSQVPTCFLGLCEVSAGSSFLSQHTLRAPRTISLQLMSHPYLSLPPTLSITEPVSIIEYSGILSDSLNLSQTPLWCHEPFPSSAPPYGHYPMQARTSCWLCLPMAHSHTASLQQTHAAMAVMPLLLVFNNI